MRVLKVILRRELSGFLAEMRVLAGEVHTHELARLQHDLKIVPLRAVKRKPSRHSFRIEHENSPWRV
jgi:hypothetical protein